MRGWCAQAVRPLRWDALPEHEGGVDVPEVMDPEPGQTGLIRYRTPSSLVEGVGADGAAQGVREDVPGILPRASDLGPLLPFRPPLPEHAHCIAGRGTQRPSGGLGRSSRHQRGCKERGRS